MGIVVTLAAMVGITSGCVVERIERHVRQEVMRILRPAEAAVRRLIFVAARGLVLKPDPRQAMSRDVRETLKGLERRGTGKSFSRAFQLFDPEVPMRAFDDVDMNGTPLIQDRRSTKLEPRIHLIGHPDPTVHAIWVAQRQAFVSSTQPLPAHDDDDTVDGTRLIHRLNAITSALQDIPKQARRLARWTARREHSAQNRLVYTSPLRPGRPPGWRTEPVHEVDYTLNACHWLAFEARQTEWSEADTS
jgi:hypothetical protein